MYICHYIQCIITQVDHKALTRYKAVYKYIRSLHSIATKGVESLYNAVSVCLTCALPAVTTGSFSISSANTAGSGEALYDNPAVPPVAVAGVVGVATDVVCVLYKLRVMSPVVVVCKEVEAWRCSCWMWLCTHRFSNRAQDCGI